MKATKTQNNSAGRFRRRLMAVAAAFLMFGSFAGAQVTIGQGEEPVNGALLQLKDKANVNGKNANASKGLGMPRVELTSETDLFPMYPDDASYTSVKATVDPQHTGLMVYNLNDDSTFDEGVYVWNGTKWLPVGSGGGGGTSNTFWYGVGTTEAHTSNTDPSYLNAAVVVAGTTPFKFGSVNAGLSVQSTAYVKGQTRVDGQTLLTTKATVGSANNTRIGSLLDLKENNNTGKNANATKGLGMPRMKLTSETDLFPMFTSGAANYTGTNKTTQDALHTGLMVYNLSEDDPFTEGVYVWDGAKWLSVGIGGGTVCNTWPKIAMPTADATITCYDGFGVNLTVQLLPRANQEAPVYQWYDGSGNQVPTAPNSGSYMFTVDKATHDGKSFYCVITNDCGKSVTSPKFTLKVLDNPTVYPPGYTIEGASLIGRTCFDINRSNFGDMCGQQAARAASAANFKTLGIVPYTFTAPTAGAVSNLRFMVVDEEGCVSSYSGGDIPGTVANGSTSTLNVVYNPNLNDDNSVPLIVGRASEAAAKVHIYAVFNHEGSDVSLQLTASIQDCNCCTGAPAMVSEYTQLKKYPGTDISSTGGNFIATGQNLCIAQKDGASTVGWAGAVNGCITGLLADGQAGWRAPNLAEMAAIQGVGQNLATAPSSSPGTENLRTGSSDRYWSSSEVSSATAWYVITTGTVGSNYKSNGYYVRCVRSY